MFHTEVFLLCPFYFCGRLAQEWKLLLPFSSHLFLFAVKLWGVLYPNSEVAEEKSAVIIPFFEIKVTFDLFGHLRSLPFDVSALWFTFCVQGQTYWIPLRPWCGDCHWFCDILSHSVFR